MGFRITSENIIELEENSVTMLINKGSGYIEIAENDIVKEFDELLFYTKSVIEPIEFIDANFPAAEYDTANIHFYLGTNRYGREQALPMDGQSAIVAYNISNGFDDGDLVIDSSYYVLTYTVSDQLLFDHNAYNNDSAEFDLIIDVEPVDNGGDSGSSPIDEVISSYKLKSDDLKALGASIIYYAGATAEQENSVNLFPYVLNVAHYPFEVEGVKETSVKLGGVTLEHNSENIEGEKLASQFIKIDLGEVVAPDNGDSGDYSGVEFELYLPFAASVDIPPVKAYVGVEIAYNVDLKTGEATIILTSGGYVFSVSRAVIGENIPLRNNFDRVATNEYNLAQTGDNGVYTPFLEVKKYPPLTNGQFDAILPVVGNLELEQGYIKVEEINLVASQGATISEQNQIKQLLMQGVIIND